MRVIPILMTAALIGGCSASEKYQQDTTSTSTSTSTGGKPSSEMVESDVPAQQLNAPVTTDTRGRQAQTATEPVKVSIPQLAYSYKLTYLLPGDKVAGIQDQHRTLCEQMGPARCQIIALQRGTGEDIHSEATLQLRVASADARAFSDSMGKSVSGAGGRNTQSSIATEEVSKAIVDTKARIEQRELLVARLTEVLRKRSGTVAELIEAERSVTQAQEELDQARGWLNELQGRVAMANFEIHYGSIAASADAGSVSGQLGDATLGSATSFMIIFRLLLTIAIYLAPWALLGGLAWFGLRRLRIWRPGVRVPASGQPAEG